MLKQINNKGIGLVEAVLAVAFAVVLVVALLSLTTFNVQNSFNVTQRQEATKNTSAVLEKLRSEKDTSFETFSNKYTADCSSTFCFFTYDQSSYVKDCPPLRDRTCFKVTAASSEVPIKQLKIQIVSYFEQNKELFSTATETIFTNWRTRQ